jgi:hypothetical protein
MARCLNISRAEPWKNPGFHADLSDIRNQPSHLHDMMDRESWSRPSFPLLDSDTDMRC